MSDNGSSTDEIVRLSVVHAERRIDLAVPGSLPLVEILPGVAQSLGVLDPTLLHGGYRLDRSNGAGLDPRRSALAQGVRHGEVLTLTRGQHTAVAPKYDDVVHAVIDSTENHHHPWQPQDAARTATAVSLTLVGLCAILLVTGAGSDPMSTLLAGIGALVLVTLAAILSRIHHHSSGIAFGLAGSAFGALTGYFLAPSGSLWAAPAAYAAAGALIVGVIAAAVTKPPIELLAVPIASGITIGIPAGISTLGVDPVSAYAITAALCGLLAGALPWLTLTSTRITVVSPMTELEMFDPPPPVDPDKVAAKVAGAQRLLVALQISFMLAVLAAASIVVPSGWSGTALLLAAGIVFFFQSRKAGVRASVMSLVCGGTAIIGLTGLAAITSHPEHASVLLIALLIAAVLVTALSLISGKVRIRLSALTDTVEVIVLVTLLPLGVIAAGMA